MNTEQIGSTATWAETLHDVVVSWLRPYRDTYALRGFEIEDTAQEARLALLQQEPYLAKLWGEVMARDADKVFASVAVRSADAMKIVTAAAKKLVLRTVRRQLLGQSEDKSHGVLDTGPHGWEVIHRAESQERVGTIQMELAELIDRAPNDVAAYLRLVLHQPETDRRLYDWLAEDALDEVKTKAAKYVLEQLVTTYRSHES